MFEFDELTPARMAVRIGAEWFILEEASYGAAIKWRNSIVSAARVDSAGDGIRIDNIGNIEPQLIADCMFHATPKDGVVKVQSADDLIKGERVTLELVLGWPSRIDKAGMYDWIRDTSDLKSLIEVRVKEDDDTSKDEKPKNAQSG